jgi:hypothetical protein
MKGWHVLLLWTTAALAIALVAGFDAAVKWMDAHNGFASYVQAVGSVLAIVLAIWVVDRQHRLEMKRAESQRVLARLAVYDGVVQLMTAIEQLAKKIELHCTGVAVQAPTQGEANQAGQPTILGLEIICIELETALAAIAKTDYLMLAEHLLIKGLQVSESSGRLILHLSKEQLRYTQNAGELQWHIPVNAAQLCIKAVKHLADQIHAKGRDIAKKRSG